MLNSGESVKEALEIGAESVSSVEAARAEQERGQPAGSAGLLLEAIDKERNSLDLFEQGITSLQVALQDRRQALDQQEEILRDLIDSLTQS
jgi:hypothetical protein